MPATEPAPEVASCSLRNNDAHRGNLLPESQAPAREEWRSARERRNTHPDPGFPRRFRSARRSSRSCLQPPQFSGERSSIFLSSLPLKSAMLTRRIACKPNANRLERAVTLRSRWQVSPPHSVLHHLQVLCSLFFWCLALVPAEMKGKRRAGHAFRLRFVRYAASAVAASSSWSMERILSRSSGVS